MLEIQPASLAPRRSARIGMAVHALAALALSIHGALAAPAADNDSLALQEIVVSATRVGEESLQRVPMAISAISPAQLNNKG